MYWYISIINIGNSQYFNLSYSIRHSPWRADELIFPALYQAYQPGITYLRSGYRFLFKYGVTEPKCLASRRWPCIKSLPSCVIYQQIEPNQTQLKVGHDLDPNCLTLLWYSGKNFLKKLILKKKTADDKKSMKNYSACN